MRIGEFDNLTMGDLGMWGFGNVGMGELGNLKIWRFEMCYLRFTMDNLLLGPWYLPARLPDLHR